jgi:hypothetical protein
VVMEAKKPSVCNQEPRDTTTVGKVEGHQCLNPERHLCRALRVLVLGQNVSMR